MYTCLCILIFHNSVLFPDEYTKPLLFPCGNLKRDTLPSKLSDGGINVKPIMVYETKTHHLLEKTLYEIIKQRSSFPEIVIYFSPSGVQSTLPILLKLEIPLHLLKVSKSLVLYTKYVKTKERE